MSAFEIVAVATLVASCLYVTVAYFVAILDRSPAEVRIVANAARIATGACLALAAVGLAFSVGLTGIACWVLAAALFLVAALFNTGSDRHEQDGADTR